MAKEFKHIRFSVKNFSVGAAEGVLTNLALITGNREASGHGIYIDAKTLENGLDSINEQGGQLKGAVCHETFSEWWNEEDRLLKVPGYFDAITINGNMLVAGKFEFYESFRSDQPAAYRRLMEMAEKTPNLFGLSIEASGYAVYMDVDGNEYSQRPEDVQLMYDGMPVFRIVDLNAAAFVSEPAANEGLFALAMSALSGSKKLSKTQSEKIGKALVEWNKSHAQENEFNALKRQSTKTEQTIMDKLLKEIKEKFGEDEARHNRAVLFAVNHANSEKLTLAEVESAVNQADLEDLKVSNAALKNQLERQKLEDSDHAKALDKLKKEKADLEARLKKNQQFGLEENLSIGAPSIVGTGFKFTGGTKTLIEKSILKSDHVDRLIKSFADGTTSIDDLWIPEVLIQGLDELAVEKPVFMSSGAVTSNKDLNQAASGGGTQVLVKNFIEPYFDSLLQVESTAPTLQKIASGEQIASTLRRVSPLAASALSGAMSGSDPFGFILRILKNLRNRQDQSTVIDILDGFMGTAGADLSEDNFSENVAVDGTTGRLIDSSMFADAISRLGEAAQEIVAGAMIVHSTIHSALVKQDDNIDTIKDSDGKIILYSYKGMPLFISDKLRRDGSTDGNVFTSYVMGPGTIGMGMKPQVNRVGETSSLLIKEDEDTNDLAVYDRRQFILHPAGAKFTGTPGSPKSGPTDEELADPSNWALGFSDVKRCGFIRIRTNG